MTELKNVLSHVVSYLIIFCAGIMVTWVIVSFVTLELSTLDITQWEGKTRFVLLLWAVACMFISSMTCSTKVKKND